MRRFPNTVKGLVELLEDDVPVVRWLNSLATLPIIHIHALAAPGRTVSWERQDRVKLDVYARDYDEAEAIAEGIRAKLAGKSHGTSYGFLDHVWIEAEPYPVNYPVDDIIQFTFTLRVDVRAVTSTL